MKLWKTEKNSDLEEILRQRREKRKQEAAQQKELLNNQLNKDTQNQRQRFGNEINQVQALLKPIQDEEERLKMIAGDLQQSDAIRQDESSAENLDVQVGTDKELAAIAQESSRDDASI